MIFAIDFDGTVVEHEFPEIGMPKKFSFDVLKKLKNDGHQLILWTCRSHEKQYGRDLLQEAIDYCKLNGVVFDAVNENVPGLSFPTSVKIYANVYIDDKNYSSNDINWNEFYQKYKHDASLLTSHGYSTSNNNV